MPLIVPRRLPLAWVTVAIVIGRWKVRRTLFVAPAIHFSFLFVALLPRLLPASLPVVWHNLLDPSVVPAGKSTSGAYQLPKERKEGD